MANDNGDENARVQLIATLSSVRADTRTKIAVAEDFVITQLAYFDTQEDIFIASARQTAELTMSLYQYTLAFGTGNARYQATMLAADAEATAITDIAAAEVGNISATASASVAEIAGSANAQLQEAVQVSSIQAGASASTATIQAGAAGSLATIAASRTTQIATIDASLTTTSASIDQTEGIAVARLEATEPTEIAAIHVAERLEVAAIRVNQAAADATIQVTLTASLAGIQANETTVSAAYQVMEIAGDAAEGYRGATVSAQVRATERIAEATLRSGTDVAVAITRAGYERYAADDRLAAVRHRADDEFTAVEFEATQSANLVEYRATEGYNADVYAADSGLRGTKYSADGDYERRTEAATTEAAARDFAADRNYDGVVFQQDTRTSILRQQLAYLQAKWNLLASGPWPQSQQARAIPGLAGILPTIPCRPVFTPSQTRRAINAEYAKAEAQQAASIYESRQDAASRGFTSASPALFLDGLRFADAKLRATAAAYLDPEYAAKNAEQVTRAQQLGSQLFMAQQQDYVEAESEQIKREIGILDDMTQIGSEA